MCFRFPNKKKQSKKSKPDKYKKQTEGNEFSDSYI